MANKLILTIIVITLAISGCSKAQGDLYYFYKQKDRELKQTDRSDSGSLDLTRGAKDIFVVIDYPRQPDNKSNEFIMALMATSKSSSSNNPAYEFRIERFAIRDNLEVVPIKNNSAFRKIDAIEVQKDGSIRHIDERVITKQQTYMTTLYIPMEDIPQYLIMEYHFKYRPKGILEWTHYQGYTELERTYYKKSFKELLMK